MAVGKNILVVTKNGNFVAAKATKTGAVKLMRELLISDLKFKPASIQDAKVVDKDGVVSIDGTPHYRAKHVTVS